MVGFIDTMNLHDGSGAMFDGIAEKYDLLNRMTSLGFDRVWRRRAVQSLKLPAGGLVLDLAAGTGDVALEVVRQYENARVIAQDPSGNMLRVGQHKTRAVCGSEQVVWVKGNGEDLPFDANIFDAAVIGFGIRNFKNRATALAELRRVLKPNGTLIVLELTYPQKSFMAPLSRFYIHRILPLVGGLISSKAEYSYLPKSMEAFPNADGFSSELHNAGFSVDNVVPFMFGACHLFASTVRPGI